VPLQGPIGQLSVSTFLALVLKVRRNCFRCHGQSVADLSPCIWKKKRLASSL
jgi:hypothetical protein